MESNHDGKVIRDFGNEWARYSWLNEMQLEKLRNQFIAYTYPIQNLLNERSKLVIADFGAGSGRWSYFFLPFSKKLYVLEPAKKAFEILEKRFPESTSLVLLNETITSNSIPENSLDLAVVLGVLHHLPSTEKALNSISEKLKTRGTVLGYIYYSLDNRPMYYKFIWRITDLLRKTIANLPEKLKFTVCEMIALFVYLPLARISLVLSKMKVNIKHWPLSHYSNLTFEVMKNDALDRFGTRLEHRFSKEEIIKMLIAANFDKTTIVFSPNEPYWTFSAKKKS
jgi:SAM-dependent methyltransferase